MIISHTYKFIFLKTRKTAGTSVEIALSQYMEEADIISKIWREDEEKRKDLGFRGAQNHAFKSILHWDLLTWGRLIKWRKIPSKYVNHMPGTRIERFIGKEIWDSYYKFCVERNPWDKIVSAYYWKYKTLPRPSLSQFIKSNAINKFSDFNIYSKNGNINVDRVIRYENLKDELLEIGEQLRLPGPLEMIRTKEGFRKDRRPYPELMSQADIDRIGSIFDQEIKAFGYEALASSLL